MAISATGDFEQLAYQSDDQYVVEVQPARKAAQKTEEKRVYTGERLTLNFQDIETRAVLQLLADASGQNIVVSDTVAGQCHAAPAERAVGPGARHRPAHQGPRQAPQRQRDHRRADRRARRAREGRAGRAQGRPGARAAAHRISAGQLREGRRSRRPDQVAAGQQLAACCPSAAVSRRRTHQHAAAAGHRRPARRHPPPRRHAGYSRPPGADRSAHRHRQRRLLARARRARRLHRHDDQRQRRPRLRQRFRRWRTTRPWSSALDNLAATAATPFPVDVPTGVGAASATT